MVLCMDFVRTFRLSAASRNGPWKCAITRRQRHTARKHNKHKWRLFPFFSASGHQMLGVVDCQMPKFSSRFCDNRFF